MATEFNRCTKCSTLLPPNSIICPKCGTPAPGVFFFEPSQPTASFEPARSGRGRRFWLGLALLLGGCLCGCLALLVGFSSLSGGQPGAAPVSQSKPSNPQAAPVKITQPPSAVPPIIITPPTAAPAAQGETPTKNVVVDNSNSATRYFDDFSNINGHWENIFNDSLNMGYWQKGNYGIVVRVPLKMAVAFPPYPFKKPVKNMIISVKAQGDGSGFYGVLCHYQDKNNYYRISFSGDQYAVDKMVQGQMTELTQPFWKKIIAYQPAPDGYMTIVTACTDGRVQILVNDVGQEIITNEDLDTGDAVLFASSGDKKDASGVYEQAFFDDFSAELQP